MVIVLIFSLIFISYPLVGLLVYNFVKRNVIAFEVWVNRKVVGDLDDGSKETGETSLGGYR